MGEEILKTGERLDDLQRCGLKIIQSSGRFCFGMDAVLLSNFVHCHKGNRLLDLGTGTGILPLLLSAKTQCSELIGLEIQEESAQMAMRSVLLNQETLGDRVKIVQGDIKEAEEIFGSSSMDVITCNPPYMIAEHGIANPDSPKAIARHEICCTFDDIARVSSRVLKSDGHLFIVHRPFRLSELLVTLTKYRLEPKRMQLVYPYVDREPNMVLIEAVRGGNSRMSVERPLIIYEQEGVYSKDVEEMYHF